MRLVCFCHATPTPHSRGSERCGTNGDRIYAWADPSQQFGAAQGGPVVFGSKDWSDPATANAIIPASLPGFGGLDRAAPGTRSATPTWARRATREGRVKGQRGLYTLDGALIPGSTAACNPSMTIAAVAERALDLIVQRDVGQQI